jgi:hypothetical protein
MAGPKAKKGEDFTKEELRQRFETALRGAREVGHKQMKDISPKREKRVARQKPKQSRT